MSTEQNIPYRTLSKIERVIPALALLFLFPALVKGQEGPLRIADAGQLPDAPSPKSERVLDKKFLAVFGVLTSASAADYITSVQMIDRGNYETNPLLGAHPSPARYAAVGAGYLGAELALGYVLKGFGQHHRWARFLWLLEPSWGTERHAQLASHNAGLGTVHRP